MPQFRFEQTFRGSSYVLECIWMAHEELALYKKNRKTLHIQKGLAMDSMHVGEDHYFIVDDLICKIATVATNDPEQYWWVF